MDIGLWTPGPLICFLLALVLAGVLIWPRSRKWFSERIDALSTWRQYQSSGTRSAKTPSKSKPRPHDAVGALIESLNHEQPQTKDQIQQLVAQQVGKKIVANVMQDYDVVKRESWLIRFYLGAKHIKIGQTEKGIWYEK